MEAGECYNENGPLSCKNPGKCSLCNGTWATGKHFLQGGGICKDCKQKFYTITNKTQIYSTDYTTCDCSFDIVPESGVEVTGSTMFPSGTTNYSNSSTNLKKNTDGTYTIKWHFVLDENLATKILYPAWRYNNVKVNGYYCYVIEDAMFSIWMDHTAPAVTNIVQTNQTSHDGWATAKRLDISGTEDYADIVDLSIIDKTTQHVIVSNAKIGVTDKKWSYTCTPDLEGGKTGRVYTIKTEDVNGNISNTDFTVYNTDSSSPQIESPLSYTDWTNTAKTITLAFTDYGSGDVQASIDNQASYKACTKTTDGKYQITYTFSDDIVGNKTHKLYLRDGLGNASVHDLVIGNIDKNTYNISYNLNGGSMSGQSTSYNVTTNTFTLPTPTKTGYTFTGWTGSSGTTPQKTVTVNKGTRANLSYTANWSANNYYVTFNGNGGSLNVTDSSITKNNDGTAITKALYDTKNYCILGIVPTRQGFTFKGFYDAQSGGTQVFKPYNSSVCYSVASKYYNENNIWKYAGNVTLYAQWSYTPVSVKVPQILTGDYTGKSQFRVKCDDLKAGNIKITVPNSFLYKQSGKADVTVAISPKSGNNIITPSNKTCVYNITTKNGLSAGCWSGSFNIGLTLTKE